MLRVQDVMTDSVATIGPGATAEAAWERMRAKGMHHLVVTKGTEVVGLFSDRDAGGPRGAAVRRGRTVGDLMTVKPVTARPDAPVRRIANLMRGRAIGSIVVTDHRDRLVGIVTVADLLELLGRGTERPVAIAKRWTMRHRVPHRKTGQATGVW